MDSQMQLWTRQSTLRGWPMLTILFKASLTDTILTWAKEEYNFQAGRSSASQSVVRSFEIRLFCYSTKLPQHSMPNLRRLFKLRWIIF
mmetsp:Transcript_37631/g.108209  ORF Transcript_37631/g.108209 Transcript_37631/m.108209 type:complete len:88 (-) Transcript_37631:390-653(-)